MNEPRGTGSLYRLAIARLFGLVSGPSEVADELVPTFDMFQRPELWALSQGSLWTFTQDCLGAGGVGFRTRLGVVLPAASKNLLSIVELIRIGSTAGAGAAVQIAIAPPDASTLLSLTHRDVRRATTVSGVQTGVSTRGFNVNNTAFPVGTVVTEQFRLPLNDTRDFPVSYVLEPGSSLLVMADTDNTGMAGIEVTIQGRERAATDEEIQM